MVKFDKLIVALDMAGCPNRCRHCWLGATPNGKMEQEDLVSIAEAFRQYTKELEITSWYREPDFRNDYKTLWEMECNLSDSKTPHFELMSFWRMVRDEEYAQWLYDLGVRVSQLTLFGKEETTDYYIGRKGAYQQIMKSIDILLKHKIAPRIQVFVNKDNINELQFIEDLIDKLELKQRCKDIGQTFHLFIHQGSCEGENENLYDIRVTGEDLEKIPQTIIEYTLNYQGKASLQEVFGISEQALYKELCDDNSILSITSNNPVFHVDNEFHVYPNVTQPAKWWCLGNVKTDGAKTIVHNYQNDRSKAQHLIRTIPIGEMVRTCGNINSQRLFTKGDYITYIQNQFCKK